MPFPHILAENGAGARREFDGPRREEGAARARHFDQGCAADTELCSQRVYAVSGVHVREAHALQSIWLLWINSPWIHCSCCSAHETSVANKRSTITLKDVLQTLRDADFEHFIEPIEACLQGQIRNSSNSSALLAHIVLGLLVDAIQRRRLPRAGKRAKRLRLKRKRAVRLPTRLRSDWMKWRLTRTRRMPTRTKAWRRWTSRRTLRKTNRMQVKTQRRRDRPTRTCRTTPRQRRSPHTGTEG